MIKRLLTADDSDWTAFNGLREKIYIQPKQPYAATLGDVSWPAMGRCQYLARAIFRPQASTGMHYHHDVWIMTVMVNGSLTHRNLGETDFQLKAGQVMLQRAGEAGFQHDEVNASDGYCGIIQLWLKPDENAKLAKTRVDVFDVEIGENTIIGPQQGISLGDLVVSHHRHNSQAHRTEPEYTTLIYCYDGALSLADGAHNQSQLVAKDTLIWVEGECELVPEDGGASYIALAQQRIAS